MEWNALMQWAAEQGPVIVVLVIVAWDLRRSNHVQQQKLERLLEDCWNRLLSLVNERNS